MKAPALEVRALVKRFPGAMRGAPPPPALAGVSLVAQAGEFVALLGPSGCGKTTLLRCVAGFVEPDEGEILIDGVNVNGLPPYRRPLNTVFQDYALFPHMTVAQNIAYGPRRQGEARERIGERVAQALAMTGMEGYGERYPSQLSGGQQQRVALARAVINRPRLLLLDEPLSALDLKLRRRMQMELKHLQAKLGIAFVFVTHDQEEAMTMADRIVVMDHGRIAQSGTAEQIYQAPVSRYVADFIGEANLLDCEAGADGSLVLVATGARLPYAAAPGSRSTLLVRPEQIRLGSGTAQDVALVGQVRDRVFRGDTIRLHLLVAPGVELVVQSAAAQAAAFAEGASVTVSWSRDAARVLTE
jgi:spermidine/putrescine transport system ATP-binding protein